MKANSINGECIDKQFIGFSHILRSVIVITITVPCIVVDKIILNVFS